MTEFEKRDLIVLFYFIFIHTCAYSDAGYFFKKMFSPMDSSTLNLAFHKVSGCKSYSSVQTRELNTHM